MTQTRPATLLARRAVLRLSPRLPGEDVGTFLQGLVTSDVVKGPLPVWAGLLSPQGKALFDFIVWAAPEAENSADLLIDCEADQAEALVRRLSMYRLRRPIGIAVDPALGVHWSATDPGAGVAGAVPDPRLSALGWRWLGKADGEATGGESADAEWLAHRLALGVAEGSAELGELLWLETNAAELNGVSFSKGCYVGQENTARMNWRQKVNRRLCVVPLARSREDRRRAAWPELGLALDHLRVEDMAEDLRPEWLGEVTEE